MLGNGPSDAGIARLGKVKEGFDGAVEVVGLAGTWSVDDSEGGVSDPSTQISIKHQLLTLSRSVTGRR